MDEAEPAILHLCRYSNVPLAFTTLNLAILLTAVSDDENFQFSSMLTKYPWDIASQRSILDFVSFYPSARPPTELTPFALSQYPNRFEFGVN